MVVKKKYTGGPNISKIKRVIDKNTTRSGPEIDLLHRLKSKQNSSYQNISFGNWPSIVTVLNSAASVAIGYFKQELGNKMGRRLFK